LEPQPDPEQPLLGAVVEVALEPTPLGVIGGDDARPRSADLGKLRAKLSLETRVLEREAPRLFADIECVRPAARCPAVAVRNKPGRWTGRMRPREESAGTTVGVWVACP
jgi:hypothetical protein